MFAKVVNLIDRIADGTAIAGMVAAILAILATSLVMLVEIGFRWFLQSSTHLMDLVVGYSMALITFAPLAYALRNGGLIRVTLLKNALRPKTQWILEIIVTALGALVVGFMVQHLWIDFARNLARGTTTGGFIPVPLWVPSLLIFLGHAILLLTLVANTLSLILDPGRMPPAGEEV